MSRRSVAALRKIASEHRPECAVNRFATTVADALAAGDGPAQVATEAYRTGWEGIFGAQERVGSA